MYVNCEYLREFAAIARAGSFTKAAMDTSTSQSCLSRHMKSLEASLGLGLLERTADGVRLTDEGRHVQNLAGDIADIAEEVEHYAQSRQAVRGFSLCGMTVFPRVIQAFVVAAARNSANLRTLDAGGFGQDDICLLLDAGPGAYITLDTDSRIDFLPPGYEVSPLRSSPLVAIMEKSFPLASEVELTLGQLEGQLLLHAQSDFDGEVVNWANTKELLRAAGIGFRSKTATLENRGSLFADLKTGVLLFPEDYDGVAALPRAGKACVPIRGAYKNVVAIWKKSDPLAAKILKDVAGELD